MGGQFQKMRARRKENIELKVYPILYIEGLAKSQIFVKKYKAIGLMGEGITPPIPLLSSKSKINAFYLSN